MSNSRRSSGEAEAVLAAGAEHRRRRESSDTGTILVGLDQKVLDIDCVSQLEVRNLGGKSWGIETDPNVRAIGDHFGLNVQC